MTAQFEHPEDIRSETEAPSKTETRVEPPSKTPAETPSEKYLRQIRNVVVAAFVIWIAGGVIAGIVYAAVAAHEHSVQAQNQCQNNGGIWVSGQCVGG